MLKDQNNCVCRRAFEKVKHQLSVRAVGSKIHKLMNSFFRSSNPRSLILRRRRLFVRQINLNLFLRQKKFYDVTPAITVQSTAPVSQRSWVRIPFRPEFFSGLHFTPALVVYKAAMTGYVFKNKKN